MQLSGDPKYYLTDRENSVPAEISYSEKVIPIFYSEKARDCEMKYSFINELVKMAWLMK